MAVTRRASPLPSQCFDSDQAPPPPSDASGPTQAPHRLKPPATCSRPARLRTAPPMMRSVYGRCAQLLPRPGAPGQSAGTRPGAPVATHNAVNSRSPTAPPTRLRTTEAPLSRLVPRGSQAACTPPLRCDRACRALGLGPGRCGWPPCDGRVLGLRLCRLAALAAGGC